MQFDYNQGLAVQELGMGQSQQSLTIQPNANMLGYVLQTRYCHHCCSWHYGTCSCMHTQNAQTLVVNAKARMAELQRQLDAVPAIQAELAKLEAMVAAAEAK